MENSNATAQNASKIPEVVVEEEKLKTNKEKLLKTVNVIKKVENENVQIQIQEVVEESIEVTQVPALFHIIQAPRNCPPGYKLDSNGRCRKIVF